MARKTLDHNQLDGPLSRHDLRIDLGSLVLFRALADGDLAAGIRRAARLLTNYLEKDKKLPREVLRRMAEKTPDRAAAYYTANPEQFLAPFVFKPLSGGATWRGNQQAMREARAEAAALNLSRAAPPPEEPTEPFDGWDE